MIKCKEDLYGTHVLLSDKEAAEIYVGLINKFGISEIKLRECNREREDAIEVHKAEWTSSGWDASFTKANSRGLDEGSKKLTLSDLKPRTSTEYEKVTESIFDLRDEFERGELYSYYMNGKHTKVTNEDDLLENYKDKNLYRKVEKEIDWTNDVMNFLRRELHDGGCVRNASIESLGGNFGCVNIDISFRHERFLELCRVALRANGELD